MRLRRVIFPSLICAFLCGPAMLYAAQSAGVDVPTDLTATSAAYLEGNQADVDFSQFLDPVSIAKGDLQEAAEKKLNAFIPARASAIVMNAALQRSIIGTAASWFDWKCYRTFYGSNIVDLPEANALGRVPGLMGEKFEAVLESFAEGVKGVAARHPDKRFVVYVVGGYTEPAYSPAFGLVPSPVMPESCVKIMNSAFDGLDNAFALTQGYGDGEAYYRDFFRTDHHWNINGAFKAYDQIAQTLGLEVLEERGIWELPDFTYSGSAARAGKDLLEERVFDSEVDFSFLTATHDDGTAVSCSAHSTFWNSPEIRRHFTFYDTYYDDLGNCTITGGIGDRAGLLVANSYRGAIQRPLAYSYEKLTVNFQLHPASKVTETIDEQIEKSQADDIIFLANPGNLRIADSYWG